MSHHNLPSSNNDHQARQPLSRRTFITRTGVAIGAGAVAANSRTVSATPATPTAPENIPPHLKPFAKQYAEDPRAASLEWFKNAHYGLFMHFGLYSLLGRHEWVMFREKIPVAEYESLRHKFHAEHFDPDFITDLALDAGMKYLCITARHHDSFCLFHSNVSHYNATNTPAQRDLIGALAQQCHAKNLGLFLYYSFALDWWHPYFYTTDVAWIARPAYSQPEPRYLYRNEEDFKPYARFVQAQVRELMTNYGPIAGMWFDPIMAYYARPNLYPIHQTYDMVRKLQPHALICFKQGATGTEDYAAPERSGHSLENNARKRFGEAAAKVARHAWQSNRGKPLEVCDTLQPHGWGYNKADDGKHKTPAQVHKMIESAAGNHWNLLLNTGPLPDGSIHREDVATLRAVGKSLRQNGWPG